MQSEMGVTSKPISSQPSAHPADILIVAFWNEHPWRDADLRFHTRQIYCSGSSSLEGRRFRRAYYTDMAFKHGSPKFWDRLLRSSRMMQHPATDSPSDWGQILRVEHFFERENHEEPTRP